jgi:ferritin-like metal-binding protein YciE
LKDIYYAEKKIYRTLPKMVKASKELELKKAFTTHREETLNRSGLIGGCLV